MTKQEALDLFGGRPAYVARAMGITRQAVNNWPDPLTPAIADRVIGAHIRLSNMKRRYTGKPIKVK